LNPHQATAPLTITFREWWKRKDAVRATNAITFFVEDRARARRPRVSLTRTLSSGGDDAMFVNIRTTTHVRSDTNALVPEKDANNVKGTDSACSAEELPVVHDL